MSYTLPELKELIDNLGFDDNAKITIPVGINSEGKYEVLTTENGGLITVSDDAVDRTHFDTDTGSGAISYSLAPGAKFRLVRIEVHLSAVPTTSENFTISLDAGDSDAFDINLLTWDLSELEMQDVSTVFGSGYEYEADDAITISFANTDGATFGLRAVYELI